MISNADRPMRPYYLLVQLPGQSHPQFVLVMPYTPNNKDNMVGYMSVSSDPDSYGAMTLFSLNRARQIFGPTQVNNKILSNQEISQRLSLLNQQGSKVTLGNLLIVPIKDSLLYVQPIFVQGSGQSPYPLLTFVAVVYNDQVGFASTLGDAIGEVIQGTPPPSQPTPPTPQAPTGSATVQQLLAQANTEYNLAQQELRKGNLAGYQQHMNKVGSLLSQLARIAGRTPAGTGVPATSTTVPK
jgi:uncharacterized membrane protein (UPF0182 family)